MGVAVVTGANKGIGLAIVRSLCEKYDGDVLLTSRDEARGQAAMDTLRGEGLEPKFHLLDICEEQSVLRLRDFLEMDSRRVKMWRLASHLDLACIIFRMAVRGDI